MLAPNPSVFTGSGTNTYVIGTGDRLVVVDPGSSDSGHLEKVVAAASGMGTAAAILLTHHHPDHTDGAVELAARLSVPLRAFPHHLAPPLDAELADGDTIDIGAGSLRVIHTPGHATDHVCLLWDAPNLLLAGDLIAGAGFIVIDPPDGNMAAYLASLARVRDLDAVRVLPGHGPAIDDPRGHIEGYIGHRLEREATVLGAVPAGSGVPLEAILPVAYSDTPESMHPVAARSLLAHLEKLVDDGAVVREGDAGAARYRRV